MQIGVGIKGIKMDNREHEIIGSICTDAAGRCEFMAASI